MSQIQTTKNRTWFEMQGLGMQKLKRAKSVQLGFVTLGTRPWWLEEWRWM